MILPHCRSLAYIVLLTCRTGVAQAPRDATPAAAARVIDSILHAAYPADKPGAAVLVIQHGRVLLRRGYGLAQVDPARPVEPGMIFRIGSMTKQFTAVAILQLIEAGKLHLDSRVEELLPSAPAAWRGITVEQLLEHSSGLAADAEQPDSEDPKPRTVVQLLDLARGEPLRFSPGTDWAYSNAGYVVLGAIIERLSGMSYSAYIEARIARPAGLHDTHYDAGDDANPRRARGYTLGGGDQVVPAGFLHMSQPYAAGALVSTVDDLWRWEKQLASGRLISRELLGRAWTAAVLPDGRHTGYGFGWFSSQVDGHGTHEHGGAVNGFSSYALAIPDHQTYVILLTNRQIIPGAPILVADLSLRIARILLGNAERPPVAPQADLAALTGTFRVGPGLTRVITVEGGTLFSQATGRPRFALVPVGVDHFAVTGSDTQFFFTRDAAGRIIGMRSRPRLGMEQYAERVE